MFDGDRSNRNDDPGQCEGVIEWVDREGGEGVNREG